MYSVTGPAATTIYQENGGTQGKVNTVLYPATGLAPFALRSPTRYFEAEVADSGIASPCQLEAPYIDAGTAYGAVIAITAAPCQTGGVAQLSQVSEESTMAVSTLNELCSYLAHACFTPAVPLSLPEGIAVDGDGNLWIANAGNASVSTLFYARTTNSLADYSTTSPIAYQHGAGQGATVSQPYGLAIDRSGNVWLSNAGCVSTNGTACTPGAFCAFGVDWRGGPDGDAAGAADDDDYEWEPAGGCAGDAGPQLYEPCGGAAVRVLEVRGSCGDGGHRLLAIRTIAGTDDGRSAGKSAVK